VNTTLLIEALVRQTMVLIATLATHTGSRTRLARVADQVFADLVGELKARGVGNKVIADMFGMAMRTYHYRMARMAESATERGRSVWEAVLQYVQDQGTALRADVLRRFERDDAEIVRGVLRDLVDSRLLFRSGRGDATAYRVAGDESVESDADEGALEQLLLVALHRAPGASLEQLANLTPLSLQRVSSLIERLVADGRVQGAATVDGVRYSVESLVIDYGDDEGWQAALFDHYQAMVSAMCTKLRSGQTRASARDYVGGSTYHFDLWQGHPLESEVLEVLADTRARVRALCERVQRINAEHAPDTLPNARRVTAYVGQTVVQDEEASDDEA
jgi:DNA-binding MarR family transcriptional regulator